MTVDEFAARSHVPRRTVTRWLERWLHLGVAGVAKNRSARGRGGSWQLAADLYDRWIACDLPSPRSV